ncbi:MAG: hypothetical protein IJ796_10700 [Lachnospiraceae bacterium]|nr:hypothetical protein [Lachnospiraceae bacterium]
MKREEYTLNDLIYTPGPIEEVKRNTEVDPDWDEKACLERSKKNREIGEKLLREFKEREHTGKLTGIL